MGNARLEAGPGLDPKKAKGRLKNLRTKFVSLVNVPANLEPWLIMKSLIAKGGSVADPNAQLLLPAETKDGLEQLFGSVSQVAGDLLGMIRDADTTTEPLAEPIPPEVAAGISALVQMLTGETAEEEAAEQATEGEGGAPIAAAAPTTPAKLCAACIAACQSCIAACKAAPSPQSQACIDACTACIAACQVCIDAGAGMTAEQGASCATACTACATACAAMQMPECQACASACTACAAACTSMGKSAGPDGGLNAKACHKGMMSETDKAALLGKMAEVIDAFAKMSNPEEDMSVEDMGKNLQSAAAILKSLIVKTAAAPAAGASAAPTGPTAAPAPGPVASAGAPPAPSAPVVVKDADGAAYSPAVLAMAKALVGAQMRKSQEVPVASATASAVAPIAKAGKMLSAATKSAIQGAMAKLQETLDREKAAATAAMATQPQPGKVAGPAEDAEGIAKSAVIAKALETEKAERVRVEKALKESQAEALRYRNAAQASNAQSLGAVPGTPAAAPKAKDVSLTAMVREKNAIADAATRQRS